MPLPTSLPLSLPEIEAEFSAPDGTPFSEFVRGGAWVPDNAENQGVPTTLPMAITDFFGAASTVPFLFTIPQSPGNDVGVYDEIDGGAYVVAAHSNLNPQVELAAEYVIDLRVRCSTDHVDGSDQPAEMPGYSWQRSRLNILMGIEDNAGRFNGLILELNFTSSTSGYVRVGYASLVTPAEDPNDERQVLASEQYNDGQDADYGNFVIPDGSNEVRLKFTRGDSGTTPYSGGGSTRYAANYNIYIYERDGWTVLWENIQLRGGQFFGTSTEWDTGGTLVIGNSTYSGGGTCDLEITSLAAAVGTTDIP
jgi:hypothetical protein